jgi:repressor of nif and glnA expression
MSFESRQDVERKILSILKVLGTSQKPVGARIIAQRLQELGIELSERAVRYPLQLTDARGLTRLVTERDGRILTEMGANEIEHALVKDKIGFAISRIERLAFRSEFDYSNKRGVVRVNISFFSETEFDKALKVMIPVFDAGFCVSNLVVIARDGQKIGEVIIPPGNVGIATICSIIVNGTLLKAGIPMDSKFGGILQFQDHKPVRFTQVIHYNGSSLDPSEIFIKANMTSVRDVIASGDGEILANFREIPAICRRTAEKVIDGLTGAGMKGVIVMGNTSEPACQMNVELNKIGIVLIGGLNPVAAAAEAGIQVENHSMSTVVDYKRLIDIHEARELPMIGTPAMKI